MITYAFGQVENGTEVYNRKRGRVVVPHRYQKIYKDGKEIGSVEIFVMLNGEVGTVVKYKNRKRCCEEEE